MSSVRVLVDLNLDVMIVFRGKGDYHRLGHGTDEHVRKPKKVSLRPSSFNHF